MRSPSLSDCIYRISDGSLLPVSKLADSDTAGETVKPNIDDLSTTHANKPKPEVVDRNTSCCGTETKTGSLDIWSAAYLEAIESFGKDIDVAILKGSSAAQLFTKLEEVDKDATQESAFLRGVAYLHSIQVPLERFKLALDLASPLSALEPATAAVFSVVKGVTAVSLFQRDTRSCA